MASPIGRFYLFKSISGRREPELLPATSPETQCLKSACHLALAILESNESCESLACIARSLIRLRAGRAEHHVYNRPLEDLTHWAAWFVRVVRHSFPNVLLSDHVRGEAELDKFETWSSMEEFQPSSSGLISINSRLMENYMLAHFRANGPNPTNHELNTWDRFCFIMAVSIAHEIVHLFITFLTGGPIPNTPPGGVFEDDSKDMEDDDDDDDDDDSESAQAGESGYTWEVILWGGQMFIAHDPYDDLEHHQSGRVLILDKHGQAAALSLDYIRRINQYRFSFPAELSGPWDAEEELTSMMKYCKAKYDSNHSTASDEEDSRESRQEANRRRREWFNSLPNSMKDSNCRF